MEDKKLENLHAQYERQSQLRGKKGGLGVEGVYKFKGLTLPGAKQKQDPKQPYIRFVKAGYQPEEKQNSKRTVFESDDDSSGSSKLVSKNHKKRKKTEASENSAKKVKLKLLKKSNGNGNGQLKCPNNKSQSIKSSSTANMARRKKPKAKKSINNNVYRGEVVSKKKTLLGSSNSMQSNDENVSAKPSARLQKEVKLKSTTNVEPKICYSVKILTFKELKAASSMLAKEEKYNFVCLCGTFVKIKVKNGSFKRKVSVISSSLTKSGKFKIFGLSSVGEPINAFIKSSTVFDDNFHLLFTHKS